MGEFFCVKDPRGISISCSTEQWYEHVVSRREFMRNNVQAVSETLMLPDLIYQDPKHPNREIYIKSGNMTTRSYGNDLYTHVIVQNVTNSSSELITAWPSETIKRTLTDVKYHK